MLRNVTPIRPAPQFSPDQIASIAAAAGAMVNAGLQILDAIGGDPDEEDSDPPETNGDELDNCCDEDAPLFGGVAREPRGMGPGCPISDPDHGAEEAGEREEF